VELHRRDFLKVAGLVGLGIVAKPVYELLSPAKAAEELASVEIRAGQRLAMVIDVKATRDDFKSAIEACHRVHNVPDFGKALGDGKVSETESVRQEIKWMWTTDYEGAFAEQGHHFVEEYLHHSPIPVLCNHCDSAPCVRVCPTRSTWKRKEDGVVMMDYHRCIGCRFCMAACPYGARSFNWRDPRPFVEEESPGFPTRSKGVVEKCNFCAERLARGLIPACVEATQDDGSNALAFGDLSDAESAVRELVTSRYSIRRKPEAGTDPSVYYLV
jgi:molybdopterin-containing oxidoreductase family iron-sulfur binding subunit